jgi:hypothetical protein
VPQLKFLCTFKKEKIKGKKFLILYWSDPMFGFFGDVDKLLRQIIYAKAHGYDPVIDLQNYKNAVISPKDIGKKNGWDSYFLQPSGYSLQETRETYARYISRKEIKESEQLTYGKDEFQRYIVLNENMHNYVETLWKPIGRYGKILGVLCRGTDYLLPAFGFHPLEADEFIPFCKKRFAEGGYSKIFLATEDSDILSQFKTAFGKELLYLEDYRSTFDQKHMFIREQWEQTDIDMEEKNRNYIAAIYILGKCDAFIANVRTSAVPFVQLIKEGEFEYEKIFVTF